MTFKEKVMQDHPAFVDEKFGGGCFDCPSGYGYMDCEDLPYIKNGVKDCEKCWNREIPVEEGEE